MNKKIAIIVAFKDFKDEEYFVPKQILEEAGFAVDTVSNKQGVAVGVSGGEVAINVLIDDLKIDDYEAVVFVGGPGCLENLDNQASYKMAQEAVAKDKVLAAICISPVILAKAGVLSGKRATVWTSPMDKKAANTLKEKGALYEEKDVVADGKIITACGPRAAEEFGKTIVEALTSSQK